MISWRPEQFAAQLLHLPTSKSLVAPCLPQLECRGAIVGGSAAMGKPFLSRHFLAEQPCALASVPFAAAGAADEQGVAVKHNLLALGTWAQDAQEHRLTLVDLAVGQAGDEVAQPPAMARLASFQHSGRPTALEVAEVGGGSLLLLCGSSDGSVARLRLTVPTQPGSHPSEIQLREEDFDGALLLPWLDVHVGPVTALSASTDRRELLTAGADGSLALAPLAADDDGSSTTLYRSGGAVTFAAARWSGSHTAVTGSLQGLLHVWDTRQGARPALQLQQPAAERAAAADSLRLVVAAPAITCLDVHPAQHFCCATGAADGGVALWDLRAASSGPPPAGAARQQPVVACCSVAGGAGAGGGSEAPAVCDMRFEGGGGGGGGGQALVYCTAGGAVGVLRDVAAAAATVSGGRLLFREPTAAVRACCLAASGPTSQLFCATDQEGLIYIANPL